MSSENNYFDNFVNKQLIISKKIFRPNLTSRLSYEVAKANIKKKNKGFRFRLWMRGYWHYVKKKKNLVSKYIFQIIIS